MPPRPCCTRYFPAPALLTPLFPLTHLRPPYERFEPLPSATAVRALGAEPGSLLVAEVPAERAAWGPLREWIPRARAAACGVPLVLRMMGDHARPSLALAQRASRLHVRAVLMECDPVADTLRTLLTDPVALGDDVAEWLALSGVRLSADLAVLVRRIFDHAPAHRELGTLLHTLGECDSTVRAWFRARALPPPCDWHAAARALRALLRAQAEPATPLLSIALEAGYSDQSALSRQVHHLFGVRPGRVRGTLGWEWLLDRWLKKRR